MSPTDPKDPQWPVPSQQVNVAFDGGVVHAVLRGEQHIHLYQGKPPYRIEPFVESAAVDPEHVRSLPLSWLLSADQQVVPFWGRTGELTELRRWRDTEGAHLAVRLLHAVGGQGKSRVATRFAVESRDDAWAVAYVRHANEPIAAAVGDQQLTVAGPGLLLVVDYADRWPIQDLIALLAKHGRSTRASLRVLLLARSAGIWWDSLQHQLRKHQIKVDADAQVLGALAASASDRLAVFTAARDRFAELLGVADSETLQPPLQVLEQRNPAYTHALALHMAALVAVDAAAQNRTAPAADEVAGLSTYLLARERDYWQASHDMGPTRFPTTPVTMGHTVYTATLVRAQRYPEATPALRRAAIAHAEQDCAQILADHARCYPPDNDMTTLTPLLPDRLGEDYVALTTPGHHASHPTDPWADTVIAALLTPDATGELPAWCGAALTVLVEAAHRWPHLVERQLNPLLTAHPRLALTANTATLARLIALEAIDIDVLEAIDSLLPEGSDIYLDTAAAAISTRLLSHRLVRTPSRATRAALLERHAMRLYQVGQHGDASKALTDAVSLYRELVAEDPQTYRPVLAAALDDFADQLGKSGRWEEADAAGDESVALYRQLESDNPGAHVADFAACLNNHSIRLAATGQTRDAVATGRAAVALYQQLTTTNRERYLPGLAASLNNLSCRLADIALWNEAVTTIGHAVQLCRQLATSNPNKYVPRLAGVLLTAGSQLTEVGRWEDALAIGAGAIELYQRLIPHNPDAHLPDFAAALSNAGVALAALGRMTEAINVAQRATAIRRQLAEADPAAHTPSLAAALDSLGIRLREAGQRQQALAVIEEAVVIRQRLANGSPRVHSLALAKSLHNLARTLEDLGDLDRATAIARQAVALQRQHADGQHGSPDLASSLNLTAQLLAKAGHTDEAVAAREEAVDRYRRLTFVNPDAHLPGLARSLNGLGIALFATDRQQDALDAFKESVAIRRRLTEAVPDRHVRSLARSLHNLSVALRQLDRSEEADRVSLEASAIEHRLTAPNLSVAPDETC